MVGAIGRGAWRWAWIGCILVTMLGAAAADADGDFQRAQLAYQRGDVVAAMAALRPAAQAGHAPSQRLLAFILDRADFVDEAVQLYRAAAAQDDAEAHAGLANLLSSGRGLAKDENAAFLHFSKAADAGHAPSIELVASAWLNDQLGRRAADDPGAALAAWRRAAAQGHLPSAEALMLAYQRGRFGLAVDATEAGRWQQQASLLRKLRAGQPAVKVAR